MSFVLHTINVECMCGASNVTSKYRPYRRYHVVFARKYYTFQKINIPGVSFNRNGTSYFGDTHRCDLSELTNTENTIAFKLSDKMVCVKSVG